MQTTLSFFEKNFSQNNKNIFADLKVFLFLMNSFIKNTIKKLKEGSQSKVSRSNFIEIPRTNK